MTADIRIMTSLPAHPKTKKLVRRLGQAAGWNLICLFLFARENKTDGTLDGMTAEDIEIAADWSGQDGAFVAALLDIGFMDQNGPEYSIHDWSEHNPWSMGAKARTIKARWNAIKGRQGEAEADRQVPEYRSGPKPIVVKKAASSSASSSAANEKNDDAAQLEIKPSSTPSPSPSPSPSLEDLQKATLSGDESPGNDDDPMGLGDDLPGSGKTELAITKETDPIWHTGLNFLVRKGLPSPQARKILGKLRQNISDIELIALLVQCEANDISEPVPWLSARAVSRKKQQENQPQKLSRSRQGQAIENLNYENDTGAGMVREGNNQRAAITVRPELGRLPGS